MLKDLKNNFEITFGEIKFYVGLKRRRNRESGIISVIQKSYTNKLVKRFNMSECFPLLDNLKLLND